MSLKFVPQDIIYNKLALVQLVTWHQAGDKPLSEPNMSQFIATYMLE